MYKSTGGTTGGTNGRNDLRAEIPMSIFTKISEVNLVAVLLIP